MHSLSDWFMIVSFAYIILGSALKGRVALVGQFIYCWGGAAMLAVSAWQLQHRWAEIEAKVQPGIPYNDIIISRRHEEIFLIFIEIIILLLAPVIAYWLDQRKKRRTALSAKTV